LFEAGERAKLEGVVKALRDKARSTGADAEQLKRLREVHDALKKRHKVRHGRCLGVSVLRHTSYVVDTHLAPSCVESHRVP